MTTLDGSAQLSDQLPGLLDRLRSSLVGDLVLLTIVLLVLASFVGTDVSYTSDEQAAVLQAQQLRAGQGWLTPNPLPTIDPGAANFYVVLSDRGNAGIAFYAKHPIYPVVLAVLDRLGGTTAMVLLSVAGAVAAAAAAAGIARCIDRRLGRWTLWVAGIGSPLLFDSQLIVAHTLGAALAGGAVLAGRPWERPGPSSGGRLVVSALLLAGACSLRTEAVLLAAVLALWALVHALRQRSWSWGRAAAAWALGAPVTLVLDRWLLARIVGGGLNVVVTTTAGRDLSFFVSSRISAAAGMLAGPGDGWSAGEQVAVFAVLFSSVALGLSLRSSRSRPAVLLTAGAVGLAGSLILLREPDAVRGVLITCPVLSAGLFAWQPSFLSAEPVRPLAVITAAYTAVVGLTTYAEGGGLEWGARYLAVVLPVALALAVASLHRAAAGLPVPSRRALVAALGAVTMGITAVGIGSLRLAHQNVRSMVTTLNEVAAQAPGSDLGDGDRRPIVLTTMYPVGRLTLGPGPDVRGLTVLSHPELRTVAERMQRAGVDRFVLVSDDPEAVEVLRPWYRVAERAADRRVAIMEAG